MLLEDRPRDLPASLAAAVAVVTFAMAVIGANLAGLSEWQIGPMLAAAVAVALPALLCRYRPGAALLTLPVVDVLWPAITSGAWATSPRYWADYNYVTPAVQWWFVDVLPAQLLVAYAAGSALAAARTVGGLALAVPAQVFYMLVPLDGPVDAALVGALAWSALLAVAALLGARVAQRATHRAMMQDQAGRTLVLAERARIARELHDVAAHHMSMIAVRAASAPLRVPGVGAAAAAEFTDLAAAAREALAETRGLLSALRTDEGPGADTAPQPGVGDLARLVDATRSAGARVELAVTELPPLPAAVGLSVYRIVQEALSNATRHATGAPVEVRVAAADREVVVAVENARPPGAGAPEPAVRGAGHGLVGIRERVHLLGGSWRAGPTAGGGFRVDARLPVHPDGFRVPPPSQS